MKKVLVGRGAHTRTHIHTAVESVNVSEDRKNNNNTTTYTYTYTGTHAYIKSRSFISVLRNERKIAGWAEKRGREQQKGKIKRQK